MLNISHPSTKTTPLEPPYQDTHSLQISSHSKNILPFTHFIMSHLSASVQDASNLDGQNLFQVVSNLVGTVQDLQGRVAAHDELMKRLNLLEKENNQLRSALEDQNRENARLRGLLSDSTRVSLPAAASLSKPPTANSSRDSSHPKRTPHGHPRNTVSESRDMVTCQDILNSDDIETPVVSWATVTRRQLPASRPPPSARKFAAAARAFSQVDPAAPTGFQYVYLPRKRKFTRTEIRQNLRRLGIDPSRILDISFPARSCVGLLVHVQYVAELEKTLNSAKVSTIASFDPVDPVHLADPAYAQDNQDTRARKMLRIHFERCVDVLAHIRPHLVSAVGSMFLAQG